jgi:hypothetical protein
MIKLPKQYRHWCKLANLRPIGKYKRRYGFSGKYYQYCYLKGRGRTWRVNSDGLFQMSEPYDTFDRWANSFFSEMEIPKTYKEFLAGIQSMEASCQTIS